jgi:hypothetical protein
LEGHAVLVAGNLENLGHIVDGQAESEGLMADVMAKGFFLEDEGH